MNFHLSGFVQFHKILFLCFCEIVIAAIILSFFYFVNSDKLFYYIERALVNMFVFSVRLFRAITNQVAACSDSLNS